VAVTLQGSPGMTVFFAGHHLSNPLGLPVTVTGITFSHFPPLTLGTATWDQTSPLLVSNNIHLVANEFIGVGTQDRPFDGLLGATFFYDSNLMHGYTGIGGARFRALNCSCFVEVNGNTFDSFVGNNLEVLGYSNARINDNSFLDAGGSIFVPLNYRCVLCVVPCRPGKGSIAIQRNTVIGNPTPCSPPFWTSFYVEPFPWLANTIWNNPQPGDQTAFTITDNAADTNLCIGLRIAGFDQICISPDPQGLLRNYFYLPPYRNNHVEGLIFWLFTGTFDVPTETAIQAAPDAPGNKCHHCEHGCPLNQIGIFAYVIAAFAILLLLCCLFSIAICPALCCWCCPPRPREWHWDGYLQMYVPDNRRMWLGFGRYNAQRAQYNAEFSRQQPGPDPNRSATLQAAQRTYYSDDPSTMATQGPGAGLPQPVPVAHEVRARTATQKYPEG
jgi:hypothetical protein